MTRVKLIYTDIFLIFELKFNRKVCKDLRKGRKVDALLCASTENLCLFEPLFLKTSEPQQLKTLVPC